ncbi:MAG TPA: insulinase family protein [Pirellulales bacterium]|nr:insulinase family protein [Pirellulales bacterium]
MRLHRYLFLLFTAVVFAGCDHAPQPKGDETKPAPKTNAADKAAPEAAVAGSKPLLWPQDKTDLKVDPAVVWGNFKNGMRYAIMPTRTAPGRASVKLHLDVGSLMEENDQQGLAHFLEHLAFRATKHAPHAETLEFFQRLGLSFGAHTNANTGERATNYLLELPHPNEELTDKALTFFRDVLDGLLLNQDDIDHEKGVILSELRARDSAAYQAYVSDLRNSLPGLKLGERLPIGLPSVIKNAPRQRFVDFYEKWYTPGRATLVVAGDFDVKMVERLIKSHFEDAAARHGEAADPSFGELKVPDKLTATMFTSPDAQDTLVRLEQARPAKVILNTIAEQQDELIDVLTDLMMNTRLSELGEVPNAKILRGGYHFSREYNLAEIYTVGVECLPQKWEAGVSTVEQELRRALKFGFTDAEFANAIAEMQKITAAAAEQAPSRQANELTDKIIEALTENRVFTSPEYDQELLEKMLPKVKREECEQRLHKWWDTQALHLQVQGSMKVEGDASDAILATYHASQSEKVGPPVKAAAEQFAYTDFGKPGEITERHEEKDLGITSATFANHVRVNIKPSTYEKNVVRVVVRFGSGIEAIPADNVGLGMATKGSFINGGLVAHDVNALNRLLAGRKATVRFSIAEDAFELVGECASDTLDLDLQLCAAYLTAPGYRPEALTKFMGDVDSIYAHAQHTPEGVAGNEASAFFHGGDPRFHLAPREALQKITIDQIKKWLSRPLSKDYLEVGVVGDVEPEAVLGLLAKTVGALPERDADKPKSDLPEKVKFPAGESREFSFTSEIARGVLFVAWPLPGEWTHSRNRRATMLGDVFSDRLRLKIRNELGATYTPDVMVSASDVFKQCSYLAVVLRLEPQRLDEIRGRVESIAAELAKGPISVDEFQRAMQPTLASLDDLNNFYWLDVVDQCHEHPEVLAAARSRSKDVSSITKDELEALAKILLVPKEVTIVKISPEEKKGEPKQDDKGAPGAPASDKPAADKPAADKPAADKPAAEQPGGNKKPPADEPAADKSTVDRPAAAQPAGDK